ncbi:hypothetical protein ACLOJK_016120 [Asimina triloba]
MHVHHTRPSILIYIIPNTSDLVIMKLKKYFIFVTVSFLGVCEGLRSTPADNHKGLSDKLNSNVHENEEWAKEEETGTEFFPTGSTLPDCSHACGPCFPCKRVMVSYQCAVAESCPVVYRPPFGFSVSIKGCDCRPSFLYIFDFGLVKSKGNIMLMDDFVSTRKSLYCALHVAFGVRNFGNRDTPAKSKL